MQKNAGDFVCFVNELTVVKQNLQIDFCRVYTSKTACGEDIYGHYYIQKSRGDHLHP